MAPGSIFHHINLPTTSYFWRLLFPFIFTLHLYYKNTKNIILSYLSDLTLVSGREGLDNPFIALVFPEEEGMMQQSSVSISLSF